MVPRIELTLHVAHNESYEATKAIHRRVNLKIKGTGNSKKNQHRLELVREKQVTARFGLREMTKIGGAPLLLKLERGAELVAGAAACLRDPRVSWQITHKFVQLLWQRVLLICCGYEDAVDGQLLSHDPGLELALGFEPILQASMCRFENRMSAANCYRLAVWLVWDYIAKRKEIPKRIRLDFDGSCIPTRGQQQGSSYRKYYDTQMYFPLFVFDEDGVLITAILRQGEAVESMTTVPVLKRLVRAFRSAWGAVDILVVMDAGFADPKIYDWCEDEGKEGGSGVVHYLIKLKNTGGGLRSYSQKMAMAAKVGFTKRHGEAKYDGTKTTKNDVLKEIRKREDKAERKEGMRDHNDRVVHVYGEFMNRTGKGGKCKKQWRQPRKILVSCVHDDWGGRRFFWVTNIVGEDAEYLINEVYSSRGNAELGIRDMKSMRCDKLSCESFIANQSRLLFHVLAQRLLLKFRELLPPSFKSCSLETIREQFIRIPALIEDKARTTDLLWSGSFPYKNQMHALCQRLVQQVPANKDWLVLFVSFIKTLKAKQLAAA